MKNGKQRLKIEVERKRCSFGMKKIDGKKNIKIERKKEKKFKRKEKLNKKVGKKKIERNKNQKAFRWNDEK